MTPDEKIKADRFYDYLEKQIETYKRELAKVKVEREIDMASAVMIHDQLEILYEVQRAYIAHLIRDRSLTPDLLEALKLCHDRLSIWLTAVESCDLSPEDEEALTKAANAFGKARAA